MQKVFVTADLHFGHSNVITYENRPFQSIEQMDAALTHNWNQTVSKQDKVFVLGDVGFYKMEKLRECVTQLNGRKILVMGNHDRGRTVQRWMDCGFDEVSKYPIILDEFLVLSHEPPSYFSPATPYFYLYGHVHSTDMYQTITKNTACVCVERWDYTPVELQRILELAKLK